METKAIIATDALTKVYHGQVAVDHLTFEIQEGEIFGFLGPNGAGKTTTLLMLLGLTEPTSGKAQVAGVDPTKDPINVKRMVGYLPENMGFYHDLNARQMLRYIAELNGLSGDTANARIDNALKIIGLFDEVEKKIAAYSRGMRQRLGIAEILVRHPKIAFLDEPTLGLDPEASNRMLELIQQLSREEKMTVLISSHFLYQIQKICHRVGIMINGKMVAAGPMEQLEKEKFGVGGQQHTLEEIYMEYFQEV